MNEITIMTKAMPSFKNTLSVDVDWSTERLEYQYIMARFYAPFSDGSYSGWQELAHSSDSNREPYRYHH